MINFLRTIITSPRSRKLASYALLVGFLLFTYHMFTATYVVVNSNGIHGMIARRTWEQMESNAVKAQSYDVMPSNYYDYSSME